jgi:uncharacterized spore protein YtfJ
MGRASDSAVLETLRDVVDNAGKVFGSPLTQDGMTVLPVAKISSGGGGGGGGAPMPDGQETGGAGAGVGVSAKPLGVFVVRDGAVKWRPALDVNRIILGGQIVAVVALLVARALVKSFTRRAGPPKKKR